MKRLIPIALAATFALASSTTRQALANPKTESAAIANKVKLYIGAEHKKRGTSPAADFEKLHKICGKSQGWVKGCRFWKGPGGKSKYMFQKGTDGKIYSIPGMLQK